MWLSKGNGGKKNVGNGLVAVAVDKDKSSQSALKWAIENLLSRGHPVILIHVVNTKLSCYSGVAEPNSLSCSPRQQLDKSSKDLFLTYRVLCTCKSIPCLDVTLEDPDVGKALVEYVNYAAIESLVLGASKAGFMKKLKHSDTPTVVSRGAPDFCTVYVISKGKVSSVRNSSRTVPHSSPLHKQLESLVKEKSFVAEALPKHSPSIKSEQISLDSKSSNFNNTLQDIGDPSRMPRFSDSIFSDFSDCATDISFLSSDRSSVDLMYSPHYDLMDSSSRTPNRLSCSSDQSFSSALLGGRCPDFNTLHDFSFLSQDSARTSCSSQFTVSSDEGEAEMRRMRMELKQTMDLYGTACKEALTAKQKALELERLRMQEDKRSSQQKGNAYRYRKYTFEEIQDATNNFDPSRKIGEGRYGSVFKCTLDHTSVAVRILWPDAVQVTAQFNQEVEVLSCIRHPNLVLLLGACPEHGFLVYECMSRGSLEERLFRRGSTAPLTWQMRFKIAAGIATGLHFLHQAKPEPIIHQDLKPSNVMLDQNYVSKIGDVGLGRLVPLSVDKMTSAVDPEYQETGILEDVYSLGVLLLQLMTAKSPMTTTHQFSMAMEKGRDTFLEVLDPSVPDWPLEETLSLVKLGVRCAQDRKKDRPDLGKVVLPELARLRDFADIN